MSVQKFHYLLQRAEYRQNDRKYFPLWVRRYAESVQAEKGRLPVTLESVTTFSRSLRDNGMPAWQRLQAVRAVEAYRDLVLRTGEPSLAEMRQALQRRAAQERQEDIAEGVGTSGPGIRDERHLAGVIPSFPGSAWERAVFRALPVLFTLHHQSVTTLINPGSPA